MTFGMFMKNALEKMPFLRRFFARRRQKTVTKYGSGWFKTRLVGSGTGRRGLKIFPIQLLKRLNKKGIARRLCGTEKCAFFVAGFPGARGPCIGGVRADAKL